ncbi:hypothetical protein AcetOrient_orf04422 [Acetobacter orientalis]|uniref:Uncharacterized protein n=1 Tax=Acetobacter orientalis TaxID=146474 RepID=A0A2Z5ZLG8_9PROT|nr:hypothetical protein AcetOrient_orf04422 [Acetobacter orientalis]
MIISNFTSYARYTPGIKTANVAKAAGVRAPGGLLTTIL